ncbi:glycosyltransferase family 4 protein [Serratia fonticola]|uniref:glycosyltransferase family 4 protein n=1 Tax=Serratia fonticola TaxID=47917 RepID=UPI003AB07B5B
MILNASKLGKAGTGMWNYTKAFIESAYRIGNVDGVICPEQHSSYFKKYTENVIIIPDAISSSSKVSKVKPVIFMLYSYWLGLKVEDKNIFVSTTHHAIPFIKNQVITIHDLRPYFFPDSLLQKIYFRYILPGVARKCSAIFTVSLTVKNQLIEHFGIEPEKIHVIYNSINNDEFSAIDSSNSNNILAVGANWKHKNIHSFIKASIVWRDKFNLRIVCSNTSYSECLKELVKTEKLEGCVTFLHDIPFEKLKLELSNAWCLIYPSIDEGFGIPPIEAMASNTPVIASDIPVFREVLGDSAVYVDPSCNNSWSLALDTLEKQRAHYIEQGKFTVSKYTKNNMQDMISQALIKLKQENL